MKIDSYIKGESTTDVMNNLANYLLMNKMIIVGKDCGVQEISEALCNFEVHVIRWMR